MNFCRVEIDNLNKKPERGSRLSLKYYWAKSLRKAITNCVLNTTDDVLCAFLLTNIIIFVLSTEIRKTTYRRDQIRLVETLENVFSFFETITKTFNNVIRDFIITCIAWVNTYLLRIQLHHIISPYNFLNENTFLLKNLLRYMIWWYPYIM